MSISLGAVLLFAVVVEPAGSITGTVDKSAQVTAVVAVDRTTDKKFPGKLDDKSGRFTLEGLPLGAKYDVLIDYGGARLEGVNLKVPPADDAEDLTKEDIETIKTTAKSLNQFEDVVEVTAVRGHSRHAAVLLDKLRTKPFVNSTPGEVVWRVELWHFEKPDETWIKVQDELFIVLYRERIQKAAFDKKAVTFDPDLGGLEVTKDKPSLEVGTIKLPATEPGIHLRSAK